MRDLLQIFFALHFVLRALLSYPSAYWARGHREQ